MECFHLRGRGLAAVALFAAGQRVLRVAFALVFVVNLVLIYAWAQ